MEIILFTFGDSTEARTWSNIPYLLSEHLRKLGIKINRINIAPNKFVAKCFNVAASKIFKYPIEYDFTRTLIFNKIVDFKIKRAVEKFQNADFCIFLTFSYYNKYNDIPSLLFSDWTYSILLRDRLHREPTQKELKFISRENNAIINAKIVLPLFSETKDILKHEFPKSNIYSIPFNVINNLGGDWRPSNFEFKQKFRSNYILFIGRQAYKSGLDILVEAIRLSGFNIHLHVIGMDKQQYGEMNVRITFHGYLQKDNPDELNLYYNLLKNAKCVINPTPIWAAYSSIVEAMFYYNPIIITPFEQFIKEFGSKINFGYYTIPGSITDLSANIKRLFSLTYSEYTEMIKSSHETVKDYTWIRYIEYIVNFMKSNIKK